MSNILGDPVGSSITRAFLNAENGNALNVDGRFTGTPLLIDDGGDGVGWAAVANAGTWDFTDPVDPFPPSAGCISITSASNGDSATWTSPTPIDGTTYSAFTVQTRLVAYAQATNTIDIQCSLAGVPVGNSFNLATTINQGVLGSYQNAVVPLETDLGITTESFDEVTITIGRTGGPTPTVRFDDFYAQDSNGGVDYVVVPDTGTDFYVSGIRFAFAATGVGATVRNPGQLLGIDLTNGLVINRTAGGNVVQGRNIASIVDFIGLRFNEDNWVDGETETSVTFQVDFDPPLVLAGSAGDRIAVNVQDNLAPLLTANAVAFGESRDSAV